MVLLFWFSRLPMLKADFHLLNSVSLSFDWVESPFVCAQAVLAPNTQTMILLSCGEHKVILMDQFSYSFQVTFAFQVCMKGSRFLEFL
jgi:hypothetical protein